MTIGNKRLGKDVFVMEFTELRLSNTNTVTSRVGQLKAPLIAISLCSLWLNIKENFNSVPVLPKVKTRFLL